MSSHKNRNGSIIITACRIYLRRKQLFCWVARNFLTSDLLYFYLFIRGRCHLDAPLSFFLIPAFSLHHPRCLILFLILYSFPCLTANLAINLDHNAGPVDQDWEFARVYYHGKWMVYFLVGGLFVLVFAVFAVNAIGKSWLFLFSLAGVSRGFVWG